MDVETLRTWEADVRDPSPPGLPPYGMEKQALDEWGFTFNATRPEDREALDLDSWSWSIACIWIAWRTREGAASAVAAFRHWKGLIWREREFDVRPGRLMPLPEAEVALRNALRAGAVKADGVRGDDVVPIPAAEWPRLAWEKAEHGEVIEFDHLTMLETRRYSGVVIPRAALLQAWPALDGWAPAGSDVVDVDPADVREARPETQAAEAAALVGPVKTKNATSDVSPSRGAEARAAKADHAQRRIAFLRERVPDLDRPGAMAALRRHSDEYQKLHDKPSVGGTQHKKDVRALRRPQQ